MHQDIKLQRGINHEPQGWVGTLLAPCPWFRRKLGWRSPWRKEGKKQEETRYKVKYKRPRVSDEEESARGKDESVCQNARGRLDQNTDILWHHQDQATEEATHCKRDAVGNSKVHQQWLEKRCVRDKWWSTEYISKSSIDEKTVHGETLHDYPQRQSTNKNYFLFVRLKSGIAKYHSQLL